MIETTDLHWAAGFLDGEGCFLTVFKTSHKNKRPDIQRARGYHGRFKPIQAELFHA
jgi:hypothetical protein